MRPWMQIGLETENKRWFTSGGILGIGPCFSARRSKATSFFAMQRQIKHTLKNSSCVAGALELPPPPLPPRSPAKLESMLRLFLYEGHSLVNGFTPVSVVLSNHVSRCLHRTFPTPDRGSVTTSIDHTLKVMSTHDLTFPTTLSFTCSLFRFDRREATPFCACRFPWKMQPFLLLRHLTKDGSHVHPICNVTTA